MRINAWPLSETQFRIFTSPEDRLTNIFPLNTGDMPRSAVYVYYTPVTNPSQFKATIRNYVWEQDLYISEAICQSNITVKLTYACGSINTDHTSWWHDFKNIWPTIEVSIIKEGIETPILSCLVLEKSPDQTWLEEEYLVPSYIFEAAGMYTLKLTMASPEIMINSPIDPDVNRLPDYISVIPTDIKLFALETDKELDIEADDLLINNRTLVRLNTNLNFKQYEWIISTSDGGAYRTEKQAYFVTGDFEPVTINANLTNYDDTNISITKTLQVRNPMVDNV